MFKKVILYLILCDIIVTINASEDSKIDKTGAQCLSLNQKNNDSKCLKYKEMSVFEELMRTIGLRLMTAYKVAVAKWDSKTAIVDPDREEQVIQTIVEQSHDIGLDLLWARSFFRDQIDANVFIQQKLHEKWNMSGHRPEGPTVDLKTEVRPIIDRLNKELIVYSNQTKDLRESESCLHMKRMSAKKMAKNLSMNTNDIKAYNMASIRICLPVPMSEHSSDGCKFKALPLTAFFTVIIVSYFILYFK